MSDYWKIDALISWKAKGLSTARAALAHNMKQPQFFKGFYHALTDDSIEVEGMIF